jgi:asparaginyl-tRNA synthetase
MSKDFMTGPSIKHLLSGDEPAGSDVCVQGWVRSRRDSKAGISFFAVHDGSCFDAIQLVVPDTLENYQSELLHAGVGCSIKAFGQLVESQGKGQDYEVQADRVEVIGWVEGRFGHRCQCGYRWCLSNCHGNRAVKGIF